MKFAYSEYGDGEPFLTPDQLFATRGVAEFLIQHGEEGLGALPGMDEQVQAILEDMVRAGLLERDEEGGLRLTPRMVRGMQHRAMLEIFRGLKAGVREGHASLASGRSGERTEGTRPYGFGDPLSEIAMAETLRNALARAAREGREAGEEGRPLRPGGGIGLSERDFEVHEVEASADAAVCVLIDLSGSMARYGRHIAAKRVAMGMRALIRERFPQDTLDLIGFASVAEPLPERDLPLVMPRPITTRAWDVRVRVPLDQAGLTHPHFTNLHHALRLARSTLARRGAPNKQILIVTDGEPTAHLTASEKTGGTMLNLIYPPSEASAEATLAEALRCQQAGIRLATFALIEEYHAMDWVGFIERFTRLTRGVAYYCTAGELANTVMESFLSGKRKRTYLR